MAQAFWMDRKALAFFDNINMSAPETKRKQATKQEGEIFSLDTFRLLSFFRCFLCAEDVMGGGKEAFMGFIEQARRRNVMKCTAQAER